MKRLSRTVVLAAVLLLLSLEGGCKGPPPSRIALNDRMAMANARLANAALKFKKTLEDGLRDKPGGKADSATVRRDFNAVKNAISETQKEFGNMSLPARPSKNAPALLQAYQEFLKTEETICNTRFQRAVQLAESGSDWKQIDDEFQAAYMEEQPVLSKVRDVQKAYADEHFYRLVPKR